MTSLLSVFVVREFIVALPLLFGALFPGGEALAEAPADIAGQARYQDYVFGPAREMIDLGIQPLWMPLGVIVETMRRDLFLREDLHRMGKGVRFHPFLKGLDVNRFLHAGKLTAGVGGDLPGINACLDDQVRVVSMMEMGYSTIVTRDSMLLTDLRGLRIGYPPGSASHLALLKALAIVEMTAKDVHLIAMDVHAMPAALRQGEIDAYSAWEPTPTLSTSQGWGWPLFRSTMVGYLYFAPALARDDPLVVKHFLASQVRALIWLRQSERHLRQAVQWAVQSARDFIHDIPLPAQEELEVIALRGLRRLGTVPAIEEQGLTREGHLGQMLGFLKKIGKIPDSVSLESVRSCYDLKTLQEVLDDPAGHRLRIFSYQGVDTP
ncbi:MAG: ABC transporter substrate-binding protein [Magnetococcales bacterium]|nr:ABC transporter substrate-binding protein [Magnetococcales bacterium]